MSKLFNRGDDLERELRRIRPEPRAEFLAAMTDQVGRVRRTRTPRLRLGFAGVLTAAMVTSLAAFGGLSYAASAVESVAHVATKVVAPAKHHAAKKAVQVQQTKQLSSAAAQYPAKITICHFNGQGKGTTITIAQSAYPAHRAHGDHLGACKTGEFRPNSVAAKAAAKKRAAVKAAKAKLGTTRRGVSPSTTG